MSADAVGAPPRVGYVLKKFPRLSETFILNEILGLEARGVEVGIWSHRPPDEPVAHPEVTRVKAPVAHLPAFGASPALASLEVLRAAPADTLGKVLDFVALLPENRRAEIAVQGLILGKAAAARRIGHLHAHFMTVAAHLAHVAHLATGIPYSVTAHAKDIYRHTVDAEVFRRVAGAASALVTVCDANRRFIHEHLLDGAPARVHRIYNGLPLAEIVGPRRPREEDLVLGVGRLVEKKGFHVLLQACRRLRDEGRPVRCVLVGDGEERARLEADRDRLGLAESVTLTGALTRDETLAWMRRAKVLAAPCITGADGNQDALPTVLIEALALGLPSVATPVGGILEIVEDGNHGLVVPESDAPRLAGAIRRLLEDRPLWARCAAAGPARAADRFDRDRTLDELAAVFSRRGAAASGVRE